MDRRWIWATTKLLGGVMGLAGLTACAASPTPPSVAEVQTQAVVQVQTEVGAEGTMVGTALAATRTAQPPATATHTPTPTATLTPLPTLTLTLAAPPTASPAATLTPTLRPAMTALPVASPPPAATWTPNELLAQGTHVYFVTRQCPAFKPWANIKLTASATVTFAAVNQLSLTSEDQTLALFAGSFVRQGVDTWGGIGLGVMGTWGESVTDLSRTLTFLGNGLAIHSTITHNEGTVWICDDVWIQVN